RHHVLRRDLGPIHVLVPARQHGQRAVIFVLVDASVAQTDPLDARRRTDLGGYRERFACRRGGDWLVHYDRGINTCGLGRDGVARRRLRRGRGPQFAPLTLQGQQSLLQRSQFIPPVAAQTGTTHAHHQVITVDVSGGSHQLTPGFDRRALVPDGLVQGFG